MKLDPRLSVAKTVTVTLTVAAGLLMVGCSTSTQDGDDTIVPDVSTADTITAAASSAAASSAMDTAAGRSNDDHGGATLVRLAPGTHVGVTAYSPPAPEFLDEWRARHDEAQEAASIGRVLIDWIDIEPERGRYSTAELEDQLRMIRDNGQAPMVTLAAVDVSGTPFPAWLGGFEPDAAAAAYNDMLDVIKPILDDYEVWMLSVANEPPFDDGLDRADFARFVQSVNDHADAAIADIAVNFTFAGDDVLGDDEATVALRSASDAIAVNYYCLFDDLMIAPIDKARSFLAALVGSANGKQIVFQELGCLSSELMGGSEEMQAEWFSEAFTMIADESQVRAAFVFDLQDWSDDVVDATYGGLFVGSPELVAFGERFDAWLTTGGLIRSDATTRPAWDVYLAAAQR